MSAEIVLQPNLIDVVLAEKRERLATARTRLAESEAELLQLRAQLKAFEGRYMQQVGVLYAELDELEAQIVEREAALCDSDAMRARADEARQRARESREAAFGVEEEEDEVEPPPSLKALFRELAKRIHPDFARDEAEQRYLHVLMARANQAYGRGDAHTLQRLLDDYREVNAVEAGESAAAESLRMTRQIQHAERDMARLEAERHAVLGSEIAQMHADAEMAAREHRDLLAELATAVREQIAAARVRFEAVDRQVGAHGR